MGKNILISNEVYERLKSLKRGSDSFTEVIMRLLSHRSRSVLDLAGTWPYSEEETRSMEHLLEESWAEGWNQ